MNLRQSLYPLAFALAMLTLASCSGAGESTQRDVQAAIDSIRAESIAGHIRTLADDAMGGRAPGTPGYEKAAAYVAGRFEAFGLQPAGTAGGYFQPVNLLQGDWLKGDSHLRLSRGGASEELEPAVDYVLSPIFPEESAEVSAPVVFAGYGVAAPEFGYDDFKTIDVRGKVVAFFLGAPAALPHDERAYYSSEWVKMKGLVDRGAVGTIFLLTPEDQRRIPWSLVVSNARQSSMRWLDEDGNAVDAFPELRVRAALSAGGMERLFEGASEPLDAVLDSIEKGGPEPFDLDVRLEARTVSRVTRIQSPNVAAVLPGSDPALKKEYVAVTAHLDHVGRGEPENGNGIFNGAYDNASGVAVMLEMAHALAALPHPPRRSVLFLAVTGEEKGLLGSDFYVHQPTVPLDSIVADITFDTVLMLHPLRDVIAFGAEHSSLASQVERATARLGITVSPDPFPEEVIFIRSDQYSFVRKGIPSVFLVTGQDSGDPAVDGAKQEMEWMTTVYHTQRDDLSQDFDFEAGADFTRLNLLLAYDIAMTPERPTWNQGDFFGGKFGT